MNMRPEHRLRLFGFSVALAADQRQVTGEAPPFASIAKRPGFDAGQIAVFLLDPHPKMPNMSLTRMEAGDLAAYIATLGK
jgi:hypothetical protein